MISDEILAVDITTEPLEAVVVGVGDLHVVNLSAVAHRAEGEAIDFLIGLERIACKLNTHIAQRARVVGIVVAAMLGAGATLNLHFLLVVLGLAAEDHTAPVTRPAAALGLLGGEHDRAGDCAMGEEFAATLHDEGGLGVFVALDDGAGLDGQFGSIANVDPALQEVGAFLQGLLALEDKLLVAISNFCSISVFLAIGEEDVVASFQTTIGRPDVSCGLATISTVVVVVVVTAGSERSGKHQDAHASIKFVIFHNVWFVKHRLLVFIDCHC